MPHTRPVCIRHEEHGSTPSNNSTYKLSVSKPPILKQWWLPKWLVKMPMTTTQSSERDQPWRNSTVRSFQRPSSYQLQTRNVAQQSNLVPISLMILPTLSASRSCNTSRFSGWGSPWIRCWVRSSWILVSVFATGTSSTATREVEVSPFIPEGFAAFGDSGSQGVI